MAKKRRGRPKRQRRQRQQAQYEVLDKYPVLPPHAFARIVRDLRSLNIMYQAIEPPLNKKEQAQFDEIMDIYVKSLTADIEEIDADPDGYLRAAMDQIIKSYGILMILERMVVLMNMKQEINGIIIIVFLFLLLIR